MKKYLFIIIIASLINIQNLFALEIAIGTKFETTSTTLLNKYKQNLFFEPNIFYNYSDSNIFNHNFGFKSNLGYYINNIEIFTIAGYQKIIFDKDHKDIYKKDHSFLYGFGVGYNIPNQNITIRVNNNYSNLKRKTDNKEVKVKNTTIGVVLGF